MFSPCRPPRACSTPAVHSRAAEAADRDAAGADDLDAGDPGVIGPAALAQPESKTTPTRAATFANRGFRA